MKQKKTVNIIFFTQSRTLDVFYQLYLRLKSHILIDQVGFYIADIVNYEKFLLQYPNFENEFIILKEWQIYQEADGHPPDLKQIRRYEQEIGVPTLWDAISIDQRLYMGGKTKFRQDYRPRYSHEQLLAILNVALKKIDHFFNEIKPDVICTLYKATFGDCLAHLFAQARGIRSLDLRIARLDNYIFFSDGFQEPTPHLVANFEQMYPIPKTLQQKAESYIVSVLNRGTSYGEKISAPEKPSFQKIKQHQYLALRVIPKMINFFKKYQKFKTIPYCYDPQNPDLLRAILYKNFFNPISFWRIKRQLRKKIIHQHDLEKMDYILYPLHKEPELMLAQFARPYLNQIEVIRNISLSMPVGMILLVKDHPLMLGKRPLSYYRKILEIPNVRLADFDLSSDIILDYSKLVVMIRGAIGLEALIRKTPVVSLGKTYYEILPKTMLRPCHNLYELPNAIYEMLHGFCYDHQTLVRFCAAFMKSSTPVNLISDLLGEKNVIQINQEENSFEVHPHLDRLANYFLERLNS